MESWREISEGSFKGLSAPFTPYPSLVGFRVLVVEDEPLISMLLEDMLDELGCVVAGTAASVAQALDLLTADLEADAALLDVNLGGEKVFPVADQLLRRRVPFAFSTGFGPADLAERYPSVPLLYKPYRPEALAKALSGFTEED